MMLCPERLSLRAGIFVRGAIGRLVLLVATISTASMQGVFRLIQVRLLYSNAKSTHSGALTIQNYILLVGLKTNADECFSDPRWSSRHSGLLSMSYILSVSACYHYLLSVHQVMSRGGRRFGREKMRYGGETVG